ncbi:MAG TPA: hypothetical protein VLC98_02265 [Phnomibacter sp.]|nr:hypothetical protein [Phnomibacter sp.]
MKALLQEYLVEHQNLPLPGIGVLHASTQPATYHVAERSFLGPEIAFEFAPLQDGESISIQQLAGYIAVKKNLSEEDAYESLQAYATTVAKQLEQDDQYSFSPIGTFAKREGTGIVFQPESIITGFTPVVADRVIREGVAHQMVVGDTATTTTEMEALLSEKEEATDRWWLLPLGLALGAIVLIIWHYASS